MAPPRKRRTASDVVLALSSRFRPSRIEGFVDSAVAGEVVGWAFDAARPQRKVHVVARAGGRVVAESLADLPRRDLMALGKGDGRCGFRLRIPGDLPEQARAAVTVEAVARPLNIVLKRGRIALPAPDRSEPVPAKVKAGPKVGFLERCGDGIISGWAVDPKQPGAPVTVDIFDGELFLGVAACEKERSRLANGRAPDGAKGFVFRIPPGRSIDDTGSVRARLSGSRHELARSKGYPGRIANTSADGVAPALELDPEPPAANEPPPAPGRSEGAVDRLRAEAATLRRARPSASIAILICGAGEHASAQAPPEDAHPQSSPATVHRIVAGVTPDLEAFVDHRVVVIAREGVTLSPDLVRVLATFDGVADAWIWRSEEPAAGAGAPRMRALLGEVGIAFALTGPALARLGPAAAKALADADIAGLAKIAAGADLRWHAFAARLSSGQEVKRARLPGDHPPPRRVSFAVWSGWTNRATPPALEALLAACGDMEAEVLVPADALDADALRALGAEDAVTSLRLVDAPASSGDGRVWRAMTQAATGQVVVLCRGDVTMENKADLRALCAWAALAHSGTVTVRVVGPNGALSGLAVREQDDGLVVTSGARGNERADVIALAPAEFLLVSRSALALVEGIDAARLPERFADADLGLRLAARGRANLLFDEVEAKASEFIETARAVSQAEAAQFEPVLARALRRA